MFIDNYICTTEIYTANWKSKWFKCLKTFHNLAQTQTKLDRPTKHLELDYGFKLQSRKVDKWFTNQNIVFEPSVPYFQDKNQVFKKKGQTIMEIVRAIILERGIENTLWPKLVLVMIYVKNHQLTEVLKNSISPIKK